MITLEEKSIELISKFETLTEEFAPDVLNLTIGVVKTLGVNSIFTGILCICASYIPYLITIKLYNFFKILKDKDGIYSNWEVGMFISGLVGGVFTFILFIRGITAILNLWNWIAIFNPKLALAYKILNF